MQNNQDNHEPNKKEFLPYSFEELYSRIDFVEFALAQNFTVNKSKSGQRSVALYRESDDTSLVVYYEHPNGTPYGLSAYYFNQRTQFSYDRGFLKNFVENHCYLEDPSNPTWSVSKILHDYLAVPQAERERLFKERLQDYTKKKQANKVQKKMDRHHKNIEPLVNTRFLKAFRKIDDSTIKHFKDAINSYRIENDRGQKFYNTAFPLYTIDDQDNIKIEGFECRNQTTKNNYKSIQGNAYGVWLSTTDFKDVERIACAESAIDCMSHYELHANTNKNTLYISYSGNLYSNKLKNLTRIIDKVAQESKHLNIDKNIIGAERYKLLNLISIGDKDAKGAEYHMRMLFNLIDKDLNEPIKIQGIDNALKNEAHKFIKITFKPHHLSHLHHSKLSSFIDNYNEDLQKSGAYPPKELFFHYIKEKSNLEEINFIVPYNHKHLAAFTKLWSKAVNPALYKVKFPNHKDFNDDLKALKKKHEPTNNLGPNQKI